MPANQDDALSNVSKLVWVSVVSPQSSCSVKASRIVYNQQSLSQIHTTHTYTHTLALFFPVTHLLCICVLQSKSPLYGVRFCDFFLFGNDGVHWGVTVNGPVWEGVFAMKMIDALIG